MTNHDKKPTHLERFLEILDKLHSEQWNPEQELLPALLFHLLFHEDPKKAEETDAWHRKIAHDYGVEPIPWGLGPPEYPEVQRALHDWWYQPFRHDIIGNTLSADLIDYLRRDCQRLGMDRHIDLHLLNYYVLVPLDHSHLPDDGTPDRLFKRPQWYRCAINLHDSKRNTSRVVLVNDIFRLLDLRHEIHEKAVMHRVVQSANAMLSRALLLLDDMKPQLKDLACLGEPAHALQGEDAFFRGLIEKCAPAPQDHPVSPTLAEKAFSGDLSAPNLTQRQKAARVRAAYSIIRKLIERRVYRPLMIVPGDRAESHFTKLPQGNKELAPTRRTEYNLRTLATLVDSPYYSRFLLFVSACIERYLQGLFDTRKSLINHIRSVMADGDLCDQAMAVVPSRVVIWTMPYKQLYKDPALVVALQDRLGQIDELIQGPGDGTDEDSSLRDLLGRSIEAADAKYAALWKLYVFISDGLFYSGVLNKLLGLSKDAPASDWHSERLKDCQVLLVRALEALENNWHDFCREHDGQDDTKKTQLNRRMD